VRDGVIDLEAANDVNMVFFDPPQPEVRRHGVPPVGKGRLRAIHLRASRVSRERSGKSSRIFTEFGERMKKTNTPMTSMCSMISICQRMMVENRDDPDWVPEGKRAGARHADARGRSINSQWRLEARTGLWRMHLGCQLSNATLWCLR